MDPVSPRAVPIPAPAAGACPRAGLTAPACLPWGEPPCHHTVEWGCPKSSSFHLRWEKSATGAGGGSSMWSKPRGGVGCGAVSTLKWPLLVSGLLRSGPASRVLPRPLPGGATRMGSAVARLPASHHGPRV